jgi:hypothetical protein
MTIITLFRLHSVVNLLQDADKVGGSAVLVMVMGCERRGGGRRRRWGVVVIVVIPEQGSDTDPIAKPASGLGIIGHHRTAFDDGHCIVLVVHW